MCSLFGSSCSCSSSASAEDNAHSLVHRSSRCKISCHPSFSWVRKLRKPAGVSHAELSTVSIAKRMNVESGCTIARTLTITGNCVSERD